MTCPEEFDEKGFPARLINYEIRIEYLLMVTAA